MFCLQLHFMGPDVFEILVLMNTNITQMFVLLSMILTFTGGCLAHKTAVASGALIMYLRYLCERDAVELFAIKRKLRSAGPPPLDRGKNEIIHQEYKAVQKDDTVGGGDALNQERKIADGDNDDGGGGFEKLKMNLNRENELVNPLDRLNKFHNAFEQYKDKANVKSDKISKDVNQSQKVMSKAAAKDNNKLNLNKKLDPNKDDENYDYKYDDANNGDEKNEEDDNDEDEYDDDDDDDEYNEYPDYDKRDDGKIDRNMKQYYDDNEQDNDLKPIGNDDNDRNPDDNDDDYNADDGYNDGYDDNDRENVHPHINARNIGHGPSPDYDKEGFDDDENRLKIVKDYDDDEEDGDDYEYDDKNDVIEQRKEEERKNDFILAKPDKKVINSRQPVIAGDHISEQSMLSTTAFIIFAISLVILIVLYRFIRKRRIRLRMGHKYFHV